MAGELKQFVRTPVHKMFTAELRNTTHKLEKNDDGQWAKQYFLTPSGEIVSKVMVVGVVTEKEDVGTDQSFWRMRVCDPTGGIMVYAGQYQPEAAQIIANMEIPTFVAVTGKPSIYEPEGGIIVSVRPDTIVVVDEQTRSSFIVDAAQQLFNRVKEMKAAPEAEGTKNTRKIYREISLRALLDIADMAVKSLLQKPEQEKEKEKDKEEQKTAGDEQKAPAPEQEPPETEQKAPEQKKQDDKKAAKSNKKEPAKKGADSKPPAKKKEEPKAEEVAFKVKVALHSELQTKKELSIGKIPEFLKSKGFDPNKVDWEAAIKTLMNEGMCYETKMGVLKAV